MPGPLELPGPHNGRRPFRHPEQRRVPGVGRFQKLQGGGVLLPDGRTSEQVRAPVQSAAMMLAQGVANGPDFSAEAQRMEAWAAEQEGGLEPGQQDMLEVVGLCGAFQAAIKEIMERAKARAQEGAEGGDGPTD